MAVTHLTRFALQNLIVLCAETLVAALAWLSSTIVTTRQVADITLSHILLTFGLAAGCRFGANKPATRNVVVVTDSANTLTACWTNCIAIPTVVAKEAFTNVHAKVGRMPQAFLTTP